MVHRFFLTTLGDVSSTLRAFSVSLRDRPNISKVDRQCDILGGEQPSIAWYVDAEMASHCALSWRLHLYWSGTAWVIETDIRRTDAEGSALAAEFATRVVGSDELDVHLRAASEELIHAEPEPAGAR
jgi:hypothetical protein